MRYTTLRLFGFSCIFWISSLSADEVVIAVASNFASTANDIAERFEQSSGHQVTIAVGSSGQHYAQIVNGAPFDLYLSADELRPRLLEEKGFIANGSRFTYAVGRLVLWSAGEGGTSENSLSDTDGYDHLAIANAKVAPYGLAAMQSLQSLGLLDSIQPKIVQGENIAQTFQFVESGAADFGLVSLSQVLALPEENRGAFWVLDEELYEPIRQQAVLINASAAAQEFWQYLQSETSLNIIATAGYSIEDEANN